MAQERSKERAITHINGFGQAGKRVRKVANARIRETLSPQSVDAIRVKFERLLTGLDRFAIAASAKQ